MGAHAAGRGGPRTPRAKSDTAVSADLSKYLDKTYESKKLDAIWASVRALAGVTDEDTEALLARRRLAGSEWVSRR